MTVRRVALAVSVVTALGALALVGPAGAQGGGGDGDATLHVALQDAPDGLAGYEVTLELDGGTVAGADYPDDYQPTTEPAIGADGASVTLEAADLQDSVTPGDANVTLATVDVEAVGGESPTVELTDAQIDADGGAKIDPGAVRVTLTGTDGDASLRTGGDSEQAQQDGDGENATATTGEDGPGFGLLPALAALVAMLVVLAVNRAS